MEFIQTIAKEADVDFSEIAYMADDFFDIEALMRVGVSGIRRNDSGRVEGEDQ